MNDEITNQNSDLIPYLDLGTSFIIGLSVGYVIKKSFKLMLFFMGVVLIGLFVLESQGIITLNTQSLQTTVSGAVDGFKHFLSFIKERVDSFKSIGGGLSATAGFLVGLKIG